MRNKITYLINGFHLKLEFLGKYMCTSLYYAIKSYNVLIKNLKLAFVLNLMRVYNHKNGVRGPWWRGGRHRAAGPRSPALNNSL